MKSVTHPIAQAPVASAKDLQPATYRMRLAKSVEDVQLAQRLRFLVFNVERQEGLPSSFSTGLDADPFDGICDHLLVEHVESGAIVGTYRMQTGRMAADRLGYYSAQEFDFGPFEVHRDRILELGRACIQDGHRSFRVLSLLWRGIAAYAAQRGSRYLIGCSSLPSVDPAEGLAAYRALEGHLADPQFRTQPLPQLACVAEPAAETPPIPRLLSAYLALGARICGSPAIDREFGTLDFLTLLDLEGIPERIRIRWGLEPNPVGKTFL
jgi:putative hemolysin